jgi:Uma2 family endonuclease
MSAATEPTPAEAVLGPGPESDPRFDLTIDLFARMIDAGLISKESRVYLQDGRLYEKMAKSNPHGYVGAAIDRALNRRLPECWWLWPESTIVLNLTNAPLPDFSVIRGNPLDFGNPSRYPEPRDVGLFIEVAVTSLRRDLTTALELYARFLIPVYWVVDVLGRRILVHSEPRVAESRGTYDRVETYRPGQSVPLTLDGQQVALIPFDEMLR